MTSTKTSIRKYCLASALCLGVASHSQAQIIGDPQVMPDSLLIILPDTTLTTAYALATLANTDTVASEALAPADIPTPPPVRLGLLHPAYLYMDQEGAADLLNKTPSFGMFHDNYVISGVPTNMQINNNTADVKFQISIRQRLTKKTLPFHTFLLMSYTQLSFWKIYANSSPFADNNYNPALSLSKLLISNNRLIGIALLSLEHQSNGRSGIDSRSWNYVSLSASYYLNLTLSVQAKVWAGKVDQVDNPDLLRYKGYGLLALNYRNTTDRFWCSLVLYPRQGWGNFNVCAEINYRVSKELNQYLFVQWYHGYAESLLAYNQFSSMIRVGICVKPFLRNLY